MDGSNDTPTMDDATSQLDQSQIESLVGTYVPCACMYVYIIDMLCIIHIVCVVNVDMDVKHIIICVHTSMYTCTKLM